MGLVALVDDRRGRLELGRKLQPFLPTATALDPERKSPLDASDPGIGACGPVGQNLWCTGATAGASFNDAWKTFRFWQQPALAFASAPQTLTAGSASSAMTVQLQNGSALP